MTEAQKINQELVGTEFEGVMVAYIDRYGQPISVYEIMRSNAGYYVGNYYFDHEMQNWCPHYRASGYFRSREAAEPELKFYEYARKSEGA